MPEPTRSPKNIEGALDDIAAVFVEVHDYLDLPTFDSKVKELAIMTTAAEAAKEADTCQGCGELRDDCVCEDDEDEADDEDEDEEAA